MGKKDKKDVAKAEAKKQRKAEKLTKENSKRAKKELQETGEASIESILAEYNLKETLKNKVVITTCEQPSARSNFTLTATGPNSNDYYFFGGEFYDGEGTVVYNELFKWNLDKNEWKLISSLNTPPPRCSHQAVMYKDRLYIFGGEYATLDQFYHYKDLWYLDTKTNVWSQIVIKNGSEAPTARSGHRMLIWKGYIVLFGGFYESLRDVHWYNDLFLFSLQDERWYSVPNRPYAVVPKPRSGFLMFLHTSEDALYIYGGYSKEKSTGKKSEGKVHSDMYTMSLKPLLTHQGKLDLTKASWQKVSKKGNPPSPRCGATAITYKNKAVVFGGVFDEEGPRHSLQSVFYNDLYAYDFDRKKWFQLGLKQASTKTKTKKSTAKKDKDEDDDDDDEEESEEEEEEEEENAQDVNINYDNGNYFGYIDENGEIVYVSIDDDGAGDDFVEEESTLLPSYKREEAVEVAVCSEAEELVFDDVVESKEEFDLNDSLCMEEEKTEFNLVEVDHSHEAAGGSLIQKTHLGMYFSLDDKVPVPRINCKLVLKGNCLLVYGGVTEIEDIEVTLDDCWSLDLNKRDFWKKLLTGNMHNLVWKSEIDDASTVGGNESSDDDSDDDSEEDSGEESDEEMKKKKKKDKDKSSKSRREGGMTTGGGVRAEVEELRSSLPGGGDLAQTPVGGETLREFASRTIAFWKEVVIEKINCGEIQQEHPSEKDIKRLAFAEADVRFTEVKPIIDQLTELESCMNESTKEKKKKSNRK